MMPLIYKKIVGGQRMSKVDKFFKISERGSNVSTEIRAGIVTFITMAYILPVNSGMLASTGLDQGAVFMATALAAALGTILMGLWAGLPLAQAPGMGLNAFFTYTVVFSMGFTPQFALAAVLTEGVIFIILSLTGVRGKLLKALPKQLRIAISAGIGLFIVFIGLQNAGIIVGGATLVEVSGSLRSPAVALAVIGIAITAVLWLRKVKGALLLGILATWILGLIAQAVGWYQVNIDAGVYSLLPGGIVRAPPSLAPTLGLCFKGFEEAFATPASIGQFLLITVTFLYVDIFDTLGTFAGVMIKAKLADDDGNFPGVNAGFASDAIATTAGAILGTSTTTTFVESAAGVEEGGRTGLTAVVVAVLFLLAIPFYPIISAIPGFATAPALIMVGLMMCETLKDFDWGDPVYLIAGVITMMFMVLGYSISAGIAWGVIFYLIAKVAKGEGKTIHPVTWVIGILLFIKTFVM
jgi:AGZA family xanthine/uracil permease-like MFS transporter